MFGAIAGGIASALAGGAMSKLFGGGQKAASGGIQGDVLATDNNTVGMGDAGIKSAIQGSNVPNPDEADLIDRKSGSAGMPRPISYAVFCLKKKTGPAGGSHHQLHLAAGRWRCGPWDRLGSQDRQRPGS